MSLTIGLFIVVLFILPGLVAVARYNKRSGRAGVRGTEMPLTAVSTLVVAVLFSLFVHGSAWVATDVINPALISIGSAFPDLSFGENVGNPLQALYLALATDSVPSTRSALWLVGIYFIEILAVFYFVGSDTFDVMLEGVDAGSHGWVFEHIIRPAEHDYTPIATVFTKATFDNMGIAYVGPVIDVRQGPDGSVLSIAMSHPERFLYETGSKASTSRLQRWLGGSEKGTGSGFTRYERTYVGGAIALSGVEIANLNIRVVADDLIKQHADPELEN